MISWPEPARSDRSITLADGEVSLSEYLSLSPYPPPQPEVRFVRCAAAFWGSDGAGISAVN